MNQRVVLATWNIGVAHQGLVKFTCVVNMLPPMNENCSCDHVKALQTAAESVACCLLLSKAETEVREFYKEKKDGLYNTGEPEEKGDFSSSYGVVTLISAVTGKALNCEIMSKECG